MVLWSVSDLARFPVSGLLLFPRACSVVIEANAGKRASLAILGLISTHYPSERSGKEMPMDISPHNYRITSGPCKCESRYRSNCISSVGLSDVARPTPILNIGFGSNPLFAIPEAWCISHCSGFHLGSAVD